MAEKRVGDGTGMGSMPPTSEGLAHLDGDEATKMSGPYAEKGGGHPKHDGPHRTSMVRGGGMSEKE